MAPDPSAGGGARSSQPAGSQDEPTAPPASGLPPGIGLTPEEPAAPERESWDRRFVRALFGAPRSLTDRGLFHKLSLVPFLAWVGLGADGLSSSSYGPDEAFRSLGEHTYLALGVAALMALTISVISAAYSLIIEKFPLGGGGYIVATHLLGEKIGLLSGCALVVDYVMTIAVSIASAGAALFSFLPLAWTSWQLPVDVALILTLGVMNSRGVRESVLTLVPIFLVFMATHFALIVGGIVAKLPELPSTAQSVTLGYQQGRAAMGAGGLMLLLMFAYSFGGGTYTGLEAVSNGMPVMREPRVHTARRTMLYMAASLIFTASGLMICYLLWQVTPLPGKTMNAALLDGITAGVPGGPVLLVVTLVSEAALLVVGAQGGFVTGPAVLANMAVDSWVPRRFAAVSDRLTTRNGITLMTLAALAALLYTRGDVRRLVVMYSINVFLTFSLSLLGMFLFVVRERGKMRHRKRRALLFGTGLVLCLTILGFTVFEKFRLGGWLTLAVTGAVFVLCLSVRRHYRQIGATVRRLFRGLEDVPIEAPAAAPRELDPAQPTAAILVAAYGGLGMHTVFEVLRRFPSHYRNLVFISIGVIDSASLREEHGMDEVRKRTAAALEQYLDLARRLGVPATYRFTIGTDAVAEGERLCMAVSREFPQAVFFAGKLVFEREHWVHRLLHNETAYAIQRRLTWNGKAMLVLPARVQDVR